jgi:hypothetical protein
MSESFVVIEQYAVQQKQYWDTFVGVNLTRGYFHVQSTNVTTVCRPCDIISKCVSITVDNGELVTTVPLFECN